MKYNSILKKWIRKCPICKCDILNIHKPKTRHLKMSCVTCGKKKKMIIHKKGDFKRKCPSCKNKIIYTKLNNRNRAEKLKKICSECVHKKLSKLYSGTKLNDKTKQKISKSLKGRCNNWGYKISKSLKKFNQDNPGIWAGKNNPMFGRYRYGKENPNFGKKWNEKLLEKARIQGKDQFLKRKKELGMLKIGYNPTACEYFDRLNKENKWNLQHALNGGEIKCKFYFLDSYDKNKNIVVEYDESHHYTSDGNLKEKDLKRQNEIINELRCKFFRFNEREQELYKVRY